MRVAVFGAGAFGGWTAYELLQRGAAVQLVDAWGPGHARSSSGGDTRVIRATYGSHHVFTAMAVRAFQRWQHYEHRWQRQLVHRTGALWLFPADHPFRHESASALRAHGLPCEALAPDEAHRRYPQVRLDDVASVMVEPEAGYIRAREACACVADRVVADGGIVLRGAAPMPLNVEGPVSQVLLQDGRGIEADAYVFACGPWLPSIFPGLLGDRIHVTRQEIYYFGVPAGDSRFDESVLPVWLEFGDRFMYGIPGLAGRGFKIADDSPGPPMDPTTGDRVASADALARLRAFLAHRFPALTGAPVIDTEVCQYESTPDAHFIIDRHPTAANVWIVGGGSGHGFKMGPAIGEVVASLVLGDKEPDQAFCLARFATPPPDGWKQKWS